MEVSNYVLLIEILKRVAHADFSDIGHNLLWNPYNYT